MNASGIILPLCYMVLKLEPYTACSFNCVYSYSKWYSKNPSATIVPRERVVELFESTLKCIYRRGLELIPFRLSALVDLFPLSEELGKISERILEFLFLLILGI